MLGELDRRVKELLL